MVEPQNKKMSFYISSEQKPYCFSLIVPIGRYDLSEKKSLSGDKQLTGFSSLVKAMDTNPS
jgi:hypothetical protein